MRGKRTFPRGGVHPDDKKSTSRHKYRRAGIPPLVVVSMQQHLGKCATPLVEAGSKVAEGELIGEADGFISSRIHSPVTGEVVAVGECYLPNGMKSLGVSIEVDGEFQPKEWKREPLPWSTMEPEALVATINAAGIVGMGGATFPTGIKLQPPKGTRVRDLILNGVECEPYLTTDHLLMVNRTDDVLEGVEILHTLLKPERIHIGIEANKPDAIEAIGRAAERRSLPIRVVPLKLKYPQGDEKQLIRAVVGKEVPSGGIPTAVGCIVVNVGTVAAIWDALILQKPLIERVVTLSGGALAEPVNLLARIGTPVQALIDECGGFSSPPDRVVLGGPMMGFTIHDLNTPIIKGTSGILALTRDEIGRIPRTGCIGCGRCVSSCPMGLNPSQLFKRIDHGDYNGAKKMGLLDCKECGCCAYECPSGIPLVQGMRLGKTMLRKTNRSEKS